VQTKRINTNLSRETTYNSKKLIVLC